MVANLGAQRTKGATKIFSSHDPFWHPLSMKLSIIIYLFGKLYENVNSMAFFHQFLYSFEYSMCKDQSQHEDV